MPLIDFQDAVTASNLDPNAKYAVYYVDGKFANHDEVKARCPNAKLFGITVLGATGVGIFACDSENGDMTVAQTLAWNEEQINLGVHKVHPIVDYANEDRWLNEGLLAAVQAQERKYALEIEKWDAHYDGSQAMPSWASAKQYADPGPVDLDVALATFFGDNDPHYERFDNRPRKVFKKLRRERGQVELYDRLRAMQTPTKHPHRAQLNYVRRFIMAWYAGRVWAIAHIKRAKDGQPSWDVDNRLWRFQQLTKRVLGQRVV